jgi:3-isopropylmalate dehydrogenase
MSSFNIAVLPGDYIGPEITTEARRVLEAAGKRFGHEFRFHEALAGGAAYDAHGEHLPKSTLATCESADAILKGPFGGPRDEINHPKWQGVEQNAILPLRKHFDLYLNLRPVVVPDSLLFLSPLKDEFVRGTDMLILRELSSGIYFGPRGERVIEGPQERSMREVWDTEQYNEYEIERIARDGFRLAQARRKHLTLIAKSNVMSTGLFWREVVEPIAKEYPDVTMNYMHVDAASMELIVRPTQFDVIVTSNIFGDILSDEAAGLLRSLGMGPSASLNEKGFGLYEPIHGSAPDIAGQGKANPVGAIASAAMLLGEGLGLQEEAAAIIQAIEATLASGLRTGDLMPSEAASPAARQQARLVSTTEFTDEVVKGLG